MKALQKFPALIAGLAIVVIASLAISVPAGATAGPSKRVLNVQTLYNYLIYPNNQLVFPTSGTPSPDGGTQCLNTNTYQSYFTETF